MASPPSPSSFSLSSGDHLLSESPLIHHSSLLSDTGPGGADLSLSELSLTDRPQYGGHTEKPFRFSLLAPPAPYDDSLISESEIEGELPSRIEEGEGVEEEEEVEVRGEGEVQAEQGVDAAEAARAREERLQHDLIILRKLNSSFALYKEALQATQTGTEQVATQLAQTNALLDKYANILGKSEVITKLILDERWEGGEADEEILENERREVRQRAKQEEEERARREAEDQVRREADEKARREQDERQRLELEKRDRSRPGSSLRGGVSSGVRGVRGTRASAMAMRGGRGIPRAAPAGTTNRVRLTSATGSVSTGIRPGSSASTRATTIRTVPRRS